MERSLNETYLTLINRLVGLKEFKSVRLTDVFFGFIPTYLFISHLLLFIPMFFGSDNKNQRRRESVVGYGPSRALCARNRSLFGGIQNGLCTRQRTINGRRVETREESDGAEGKRVWRKTATVRVERERGWLKITTGVVGNAHVCRGRLARPENHTRYDTVTEQ